MPAPASENILVNGMTKNTLGEALPTRDSVRAEAADDGVCIETREWDRVLRSYRTATALLTAAEAERLALSIAVAAKRTGEGYA